MTLFVPNPHVKSYSDATVVPVGAGALVFVAGQLGVPGEAASNDLSLPFEDEVTACFRNLEAVLGKSGATVRQLVRTDTFLSDLSLYPLFAKVRSQFIGEDPPASTLVEATLLKGARVEIAAVAFVPKA
ncbi:MAG: RidA family protein [Devosia sp.]|nr:RidA family protein [Devosia sp.]